MVNLSSDGEINASIIEKSNLFNIIERMYNTFTKKAFILMFSMSINTIWNY